MRDIMVFNPNSSRAMTAQIDLSLRPFGNGMDIRVSCVTNEHGPPGIETDADVASVARHTVAMARTVAQAGTADALVVACFSDPGVAAARSAVAMPVHGIAESAFREARMRGGAFGVLSIVEASIARHAAQITALGYGDDLRGDRSLDLGVAAAAAPESLARIVAVGTALRDTDGARILILGCAGLGIHRVALERRLGIPVIDPVEAAVRAAAGEHRIS